MTVNNCGYSPGPFVAIRVFSARDGEWSLDAVDIDGDFSEAVQTFTTRDDALNALSDFARLHAPDVKEVREI